MVEDRRPRPNLLQRRRSWKDTLRALAGSAEENSEERNVSAPLLQSRHSTGPLKLSAVSSKGVLLSEHQGDNDGSSDAESEEDFHLWKEEERPIRARVLYSYDSLPLPPNGGAVRETQVIEKDDNAVKVSPASGKAGGAIGTRLTMTSRTGYFQDRIISPSMVRQMRVLGNTRVFIVLDARNGYHVHWTTSKPRFQD
jgi:hypothetical protein